MLPCVFVCANVSLIICWLTYLGAVVLLLNLLQYYIGCIGIAFIW